MVALTLWLANAGIAVMPSDASSPTVAASKTRVLRLNRYTPPLVDARCPNGDVMGNGTRKRWVGSGAFVYSSNAK